MLPPRGLSATKVIFWLRLSVQMRSPPAITAASLKRGKRCWKSWQGMNQRSHPFLVRGAITKRCCEAQIASSSYSSRLRRGKHYWRSWQGMNQRSLFLMLRGAIASSNCSSRLRRGKRCWKILVNNCTLFQFHQVQSDIFNIRIGILQISSF